MLKNIRYGMLKNIRYGILKNIEVHIPTRLHRTKVHFTVTHLVCT